MARARNNVKVSKTKRNGKKKQDRQHWVSYHQSRRLAREAIPDAPILEPAVDLVHVERANQLLLDRCGIAQVVIEPMEVPDEPSQGHYDMLADRSGYIVDHFSRLSESVKSGLHVSARKFLECRVIVSSC